MGLSADEVARQAHYQMVYEHKACIPNGGLAPPDFVDCPACRRSFVAADQGHVLCRRCEGTERPARNLEECYCEHVAGVNCCGGCNCITNSVESLRVAGER